MEELEFKIQIIPDGVAGKDRIYVKSVKYNVAVWDWAPERISICYHDVLKDGFLGWLGLKKRVPLIRQEELDGMWKNSVEDVIHKLKQKIIKHVDTSIHKGII